MDVTAVLIPSVGWPKWQETLAVPSEIAEEDVTPDNVITYKRITCDKYDKCLTYAAKQGWQQFHCCACPVFEPAEFNERDVKALHRLAVVVMSKSTAAKS